MRIHANVQSELDLFAVPPTQTSIESGMYVEYHPISSLANGAPIEFDVSSSGDNYMDLTNCLLHDRAKVTKVHGSN